MIQSDKGRKLFTFMSIKHEEIDSFKKLFLQYYLRAASQPVSQSVSQSVSQAMIQ